MAKGDKGRKTKPLTRSGSRFQGKSGIAVSEGNVIGSSTNEHADGTEANDYLHNHNEENSPTAIPQNVGEGVMAATLAQNINPSSPALSQKFLDKAVRQVIPLKDPRSNSDNNLARRLRVRKNGLRAPQFSRQTTKERDLVTRQEVKGIVQRVVNPLGTHVETMLVGLWRWVNPAHFIRHFDDAAHCNGINEREKVTAFLNNMQGAAALWASTMEADTFAQVKPEFLNKF